MWQGIYKKWNPISHLADQRLYVDAVHDDWEGFRIWFTSDNSKAGVVAIARFESQLLYTSSDESFRLSGIRNEEPLKFPHLFWTVDESELIQEFHRQSVNIYADWKINHYAFLAASDCIDVLSVEEPSFSNVIEAEYFKGVRLNLESVS
jgi:hypothetical protein